MNDWYLAGIIDGEGCVHGSLKNQNVSMTVSARVAMLDAEPVHLLHERFGGSLYSEVKPGLSRPVVTWYIKDGTAVSALEFIATHCLVKNKAAIPALEIAKLMHNKKDGKLLSYEEKYIRIEYLKQIRQAIGKKQISESAIEEYLKPRQFGPKPGVILNSNGEEFRSQVAAAKAYNLSKGAIWNSIHYNVKAAGLNWYNG